VVGRPGTAQPRRADEALWSAFVLGGERCSASPPSWCLGALPRALLGRECRCIRRTACLLKWPGFPWRGVYGPPRSRPAGQAHSRVASDTVSGRCSSRCSSSTPGTGCATLRSRPYDLALGSIALPLAECRTDSAAGRPGKWESAKQEVCPQRPSLRTVRPASPSRSRLRPRAYTVTRSGWTTSGDCRGQTPAQVVRPCRSP
jgi:hypothetical protein